MACFQTTTYSVIDHSFYLSTFIWNSKVFVCINMEIHFHLIDYEIKRKTM